MRAAWQAWERYREQKNWMEAAATLTNTSFAPDTVVVDPASGPVTYMKPYTFRGGHGTIRTMTIPTDPLREAQLHKMRRFDSFAIFPFTSELQTGNGRAFIWARVDVQESLPTPEMTITVEATVMQPGAFPLYRFTRTVYACGVWIIPSDGRALPTVLVGQIDPSGTSWTLPLRVDGKPEWIRFDHSGPQWAKVTTSFGQLTGNQLRY